MVGEWIFYIVMLISISIMQMKKIVIGGVYDIYDKVFFMIIFFLL